MKRALSLFTAVIALWPSIALAADVSDPESLRAILPDAPDSSWVEAQPGQSGFLVGPITYDSITTYYTEYRQSASFIDSYLNILRDNGFEGGYSRSWYRPNTQDQFSEEVTVFRSGGGASAAANAFKARDQSSSGWSYASFDPALGGTAEGAIASSAGYDFALVGFVKGDAVYQAVIGSTKQLKPEDVEPAAHTLFNAAPPNIGLPAPPQSPLVRFRLPLLITFVSGAVLIAVALVIAVVSAINARPVQPAPRQA